MDFDTNLTMAEITTMIGRYEMEKQVWQREYQKLQARLAELETELESTSGQHANGREPAEVGA